MFAINFDFTQVIKDNENLADEIKKTVDEEIEKVAHSAYTHMLEYAGTKLHSTKDLYAEKLQPPTKVDDQTWEIVVPKEIMWIEEGIQSGTDMIDWFLNSKMKKHQGAKGEYVIIPFKHNKDGAQGPLQSFLTRAVKDKFKEKKKPFKKIERTESGAAKKGLLHKMNIDLPSNMHNLIKGVEGPKGHPLRSQPENRSFLQGLKVYQKEDENKNIVKDVSTFRIAGEWQRGKKWMHPGTEPLKSIENAYAWVMDSWENKILPGIFQKLKLNG